MTRSLGCKNFVLRYMPAFGIVLSFSVGDDRIKSNYTAYYYKYMLFELRLVRAICDCNDCVVEEIGKLQHVVEQDFKPNYFSAVHLCTLSWSSTATTEIGYS